VQACAYDAARAGVRVGYLGSEVTEGESTLAPPTSQAGAATRSTTSSAPTSPASGT
jgi:hypothetical protein